MPEDEREHLWIHKRTEHKMLLDRINEVLLLDEEEYFYKGAWVHKHTLLKERQRLINQQPLREYFGLEPWDDW